MIFFSLWIKACAKWINVMSWYLKELNLLCVQIFQYCFLVSLACCLLPVALWPFSIPAVFTDIQQSIAVRLFTAKPQPGCALSPGLVSLHCHTVFSSYASLQKWILVYHLSFTGRFSGSWPHPLKGVVQNEDSVIIYTPSCHFRPVWLCSAEH